MLKTFLFAEECGANSKSLVKSAHLEGLYDKMRLETGGFHMKKLFPFAVIGAAIGTAGYFINKNNKDHVKKTLTALDDLSKDAADSVNELAKKVTDASIEDYTIED